MAHFPIYRTYIVPEGSEGGPLVTDADRRAIDETGMAAELASALLLERPAAPEFVVRFQQTTGPVVAKGIEDTAFYRYGRLSALCEVGGDPGRFGVSVGGFHRANAERAQRFPAGMLTTNTHDTKRSADVRARIVALTWIPAEWTVAVRQWLELTADLVAGGAPDDVERYFIFQTLLGAWPIEAERMTAYMEKALREAKRNSNWIEPDADWEERVMSFVTGLYGHEPFRAVFEPFVDRVAELGDRIALGQVALKLTAPGVPDIYQGDELAFHALVDPDNRRPVDFEWRQALLARLSGGAEPDRDTLKLALTRRLLQLRIRRPEALGPEGAYTPLVTGDGAIAYRRGDDVVIAVAIGPHGLDAELQGAGGRWRDLMTGTELTLGDRTPLRELIAEHGLIVLERDLTPRASGASPGGTGWRPGWRPGGVAGTARRRPFAPHRRDHSSHARGRRTSCSIGVLMATGASASLRPSQAE